MGAAEVVRPGGGREAIVVSLAMATASSSKREPVVTHPLVCPTRLARITSGANLLKVGLDVEYRRAIDGVETHDPYFAPRRAGPL